MSNKQLPATEPKKWRAADLGPPKFARGMRAALCRRASAIIELVSRRMKRDGFRRTWEKVLPCGSLCESISPILRDHSEWPQVKRTEDELLRREYLKLFDESCHFQPDYA